MMHICSRHAAWDPHKSPGSPNWGSKIDKDRGIHSDNGGTVAPAAERGGEGTTYLGLKTIVLNMAQAIAII